MLKMDILVMIIKLFRLNNPCEFEIDKTILTCIKHLFTVENVYKNVKINMFKIDVFTFWSQLSSCYAFYSVPYLLTV